jgi:hypothetical protein
MNEHGSQSIRGIAAFNSVSEQWSALGKGAEGGLFYALLVAPRDIWALPVAPQASPVAPRPHDSDPLRWRSFGSLDGAVHALAALNGWLYAGGDFRVASRSFDGSGVARHSFPNAHSLAAFAFLILQRH